MSFIFDVLSMFCIKYQESADKIWCKCLKTSLKNTHKRIKFPHGVNDILVILQKENKVKTFEKHFNNYKNTSYESKRIS